MICGVHKNIGVVSFNQLPIARLFVTPSSMRLVWETERLRVPNIRESVKFQLFPKPNVLPFSINKKGNIFNIVVMRIMPAGKFLVRLAYAAIPE